MVLDPLFIFGCGLGVAGASLASLASLSSSACRPRADFINYPRPINPVDKYPRVILIE